MTKVILVDKKDNFVGYVSPNDAHLGRGMHHRAFVTLLFDSQRKVLLQKRRHKLFDGLWDLTAISHPLRIDGKNESYQIASDRALKKEMGVGSVRIEKVGGFNYFAKSGKNCENEYCAVLIGNYNGNLRPNKNEVYQTKRLKFDEFVEEINNNPKIFTPWAKKALKILADYVKRGYIDRS